MMTTENFNHICMQNFNILLKNGGLSNKQYQEDGIKWCVDNELNKDQNTRIKGGFIFDEMGLGKTITILGICVTNLLKKTLIVLPVALIEQWTTQFIKNTGHIPLIFHGIDKKKYTFQDLKNAPIIITTYGIISSNSLLRNIKWDRIVYDEAHHLRNHKTNKYFGAYKLKSNIIWFVTGTPIQNKKTDLYNLCKLLKIPQEIYKNIKNKELFYSKYIIKRTKKEVGIDIPEYNIINQYVKWENSDEENIAEEIHSELGLTNVSYDKTGIFAQSLNKSMLALIIRAKQSCIYPGLLKNSLKDMIHDGFIPEDNYYKNALNYSSKIDNVTNLIISKKDNKKGKLIFCTYKLEIDLIYLKLKQNGIDNIVIIDGRTNKHDRYIALNEKHDVIILQIQTCCEGLNLQENYSEVYFISSHWNPAVEDQAIARVHRIGQRNKVEVYKFIMTGFKPNENETDTEILPTSFDTAINNIQKNKRELFI